MHRDARLRGDARFNREREPVAIDRERAARRHGRLPRRGDNDGIEQRQFRLEQPNGIFQRVASKRIAADQFRQLGGLMRRSATERTHFVEIDLRAAERRLPSRLASRKTTPDYHNPLHMPHPSTGSG